MRYWIPVFMAIFAFVGLILEPENWSLVAAMELLPLGFFVGMLYEKLEESHTQSDKKEDEAK